VLVNDGETEMLRLGWSEPFNRRATDLDRAGIRTHHARCDAHQGRFSRAVLAQERVDFAALRLKGNVLHGDDAGVSLRHMGQAQRRLGIFHNLPRCDLLLDERHETRPRLQKSDAVTGGDRRPPPACFTLEERSETALERRLQLRVGEPSSIAG
jgi:hypothetical protein